MPIVLDFFGQSLPNITKRKTEILNLAKQEGCYEVPEKKNQTNAMHKALQDSSIATETGSSDKI